MFYIQVMDIEFKSGILHMLRRLSKNDVSIKFL